MASWLVRPTRVSRLVGALLMVATEPDNAQLERMFAEGGRAEAIVEAEGLAMVSDGAAIASLVATTLAAHPGPVAQCRRPRVLCGGPGHPRRCLHSSFTSRAADLHEGCLESRA